MSAELLARLDRVAEARRALEDWDGSFTGTSYAMRDLGRARALASIAVGATMVGLATEAWLAIGPR